MGKERIFSKEDCLLAIEMRRKGMTRTQISEELHFCTTAINRNLNFYGLRKRYDDAYRQYQMDLAKKAIELRSNGSSLNEILEELDMQCADTFRRMIRNTGMKEKYRMAMKSPEYRLKNVPRKKRLNFSWVYNQRAVFGRNLSDIAKEANRSVSGVHLYCKKYNIPKADKQTAIANRSNANKALEKAW